MRPRGWTAAPEPAARMGANASEPAMVAGVAVASGSACPRRARAGLAPAQAVAEARGVTGARPRPSPRPSGAPRVAHPREARPSGSPSSPPTDIVDGTVAALRPGAIARLPPARHATDNPKPPRAKRLVPRSRACPGAWVSQHLGKAGGRALPRLAPPAPYRLNASSKLPPAAGAKSTWRTKRAASAAPNSRSMVLSSHSTESGPL